VNLQNLDKNLSKELYKRSYFHFYRDAYAQLHPGEQYDENWHAKYICDVLQKEFGRVKCDKLPKGPDIIINIPFRSSKSLICTIIFPVWCWTQDPTTKFICASYAESLSLEHAKKAKDLINSIWFRHIYPDFKLKSEAASFYETPQGGFRKSIGMKGQITGSGSDFIICDDPQKPSEAASSVERVNTQDFYNGTLYSRLNQPDMGVRIIIMQRLHEEDLSGHLLAKKPHNHICIPVAIESDKDKELVSPPELIKYYTSLESAKDKEEDTNSSYKKLLYWPTRFSQEIIKDFVGSLGEYNAAGQLWQRPAPSEGGILKRKYFTIIEAKDVVRDPDISPIHFIFDTAYTEKTTNDPTGGIAVFAKDHNIYITNITEVRKAFPQLIDYVKQWVPLNGYQNASKVYVEPKASGKSVVDQLKRETQFNMIEIESDFVNKDKVSNAHAIAPVVESGRVFLIKGPWNDQFLDQVSTFPNASHDEFVDCLVYAVDQLLLKKQFGWSFF
jgi:predicted phage terminase large subunit-like protein